MHLERMRNNSSFIDVGAVSAVVDVQQLFFIFYFFGQKSVAAMAATAATLPTPLLYCYYHHDPHWLTQSLDFLSRLILFTTKGGGNTFIIEHKMSTEHAYP